MFSSALGQPIKKKTEIPPIKDVALMPSRLGLNDHKAGMQDLDRDKINQIIYEASKGSKYFENEKKKDEQVNQRIAEQQKRISKIPEFEFAMAEQEANMTLEHLEETRDLTRTIVHVDMDAFYAAVETRDNPSLQHKPMAVGSKSMLSTSNYIARRFGVRAAMPGFIGKKLCPQLVIIPPDFKKYTAVSQQVRSILAQYDANFCPMSLDEAYLDFTNHLEIRKHLPDDKRTVICRTCDNLDLTYCLCDPNLPKQPCHDQDNGVSLQTLESSSQTCQKNSSLTKDKNSLNYRKTQNLCSFCRRPIPDYKSQIFGFSAEDAVCEMRCKIEQRTQLTASAGIAPNTLLAKICSDRNKPNGQFCISYSKEAIMEFMRDLPIRKVCGIGKVSEKMLRALDIVTCSHLYKQRGLLYLLYSETSFEHFMRVSLGIGSTHVERDSERKSLSTEQTFTEINKPSEQYDKCLQLCEALAADLQNEGLMGRTITVKLKTVDFDVKTRSQSIPQHTADKDVIYQVARELIKTEITTCSPKPFRLRLMGVRISNFLPKTQSKKKDTIDCFVKKKHSLSPDSEHNNIDLLTEPNRTIPSHTNSPPPNVKSPAESPAGHYCPICNRKCPTDLRIFNAHIDKCLLGGKHSRSSQKRSSQTFNTEFFTENASQNITPLKVSKQRRGKISKTKMAQITFGMASSHESIASQRINQDQRGNFAETDVVVISSNEYVTPQEEVDVPSPVFDRVPKRKFSFPETQETSEDFSISTKETSSRTVIDLTEKRTSFPCNIPLSCFNKDLQIMNISQPKTVMKSTFPVTRVKNPSISPESLSCVDPEQKNSNFDNNGTFPIKESSDKDFKSETNSLKNDPKNHTGNKELVKNNSKEELPILQSVHKSEATDKLSPQAKVMPCSALSLKDQNKKKWLEMLQKCSKNETISPETQLTESKKIKTKMDSISPSTKKLSANHCVMKSKETSSKSVRNLLQYFNPPASKTCAQNSNLASNLIESQIKPEIISPKSPSKSHDPKILTISLCQPKEDLIYRANGQVLNENDCESLRTSSNKMCHFDSDTNVSCKNDLKLQFQPERLASVMSDQIQPDFNIDDNSHQKNVANRFEIVDKQTSSSSSHFNNSNIMTSKVTALSSSFNPLTTNAYKETQQTHSNTSFTNHKLTTDSMQSLASTYYENADESEPSSEENFSQPFHEEPTCEENNQESTSLSENEPEISLQNSRQSVVESLEDADAFGETVTCPVCSKKLSASDMTTFNEHVDLCLNQDVIHNILIEQGKEIKMAETMKRRADLLSPLLKTKKKKKYKNDTKNNKDSKLLTLHSFFG